MRCVIGILVLYIEGFATLPFQVQPHPARAFASDLLLRLGPFPFLLVSFLPVFSSSEKSWIKGPRHVCRIPLSYVLNV